MLLKCMHTQTSNQFSWQLLPFIPKLVLLLLEAILVGSPMHSSEAPSWVSGASLQKEFLMLTRTTLSLSRVMPSSPSTLRSVLKGRTFWQRSKTNSCSLLRLASLLTSLMQFRSTMMTCTAQFRTGEEG